ncbi:flagellar biosynthetic protein FliR [Ketobacter alkanivorans]|nr:flagellar biosynthetic protein FliR [Ketobacter alkanivorans]
MNISVEINAILTVLLLATRMGVLMFATPIDAFGRVPSQVKLYLVLALAFLLVYAIQIPLVEAPASAFGVGLMFVKEVTLGLVMAFGMYTAFAAFMVAGRLLDFQSGFGAANLFNPTTNDQNPLLGTLLSLFATLIFFLSDFHHLLVKGIVYSISMSPLGEGLSTLSVSEIVSQFGVTFTNGVILVAPVVGLMLFVDAGIAVMSRTMPQMNVYFLFLPLKVGLGLVLLAVTLPYMFPLIERTIDTSFRFWQQALT